MAHDDELIDEALRHVPAIGRRMHAIFAHLPVSSGRPPGHMKALFHLYRHGKQTVGETAAALGVSMPTASELIDRMVEDGLAERGVNPDDRRQVLVWLTPKAREMANRLVQIRRAQVRAAMDLMAPDERPAFVRSLAAFAQALELELDELPGFPFAATAAGDADTRVDEPAAQVS